MLTDIVIVVPIADNPINHLPFVYLLAFVPFILRNIWGRIVTPGMSPYNLSSNRLIKMAQLFALYFLSCMVCSALYAYLSEPRNHVLNWILIVGFLSGRFVRAYMYDKNHQAIQTWALLMLYWLLTAFIVYFVAWAL